jgi:adenosylmethionine-8-amino-7-oxononanoate aminotransferase
MKKYEVKMQFHTFDFIEVNAKNKTDAIRVAEELVAFTPKDFISIYDLDIQGKEPVEIEECA